MHSVFCISSFDLHRIRSKRIAKSLLVCQRTWMRRTGSAWKHQRIAYPRSRQFLIDIAGEVVWAHTSPYTHCIPPKNAPSPFKVQAWRHLEKKWNLTHLTRKWIPFGGADILGTGPRLVSWKKLGVHREGERRKRPDGACQLPENCPKHFKAWAGDSSFELRGLEAAQAAFVLFAIKQRRKVGTQKGFANSHHIFSPPSFFPDCCLTFPYYHST